MSTHEELPTIGIHYLRNLTISKASPFYGVKNDIFSKNTLVAQILFALRFQQKASGLKPFSNSNVLVRNYPKLSKTTSLRSGVIYDIF